MAKFEIKDGNQPSSPREQPRLGRMLLQVANLLKSVTIPESVKVIGWHAFGGCISLKSITIPESVKGIGEDAFEGCESLTSIIIPEGVECIGAEDFYRCELLTNITFQATIAQQRKIELGNQWNDEPPAIVVRCTDGDV